MDGIPWLSILMALLTFFGSKKSGASNTQAAIAAGLVGAGTYYVSHETDWGKSNLGSLDGVASATAGAATVKNADGTDKIGPNGVALTTPVSSSGVGSSVADVLKSWGGAGTATVLGAGAVATSSNLQKYIPWVLGAGLLFLVLK